MRDKPVTTFARWGSLAALASLLSVPAASKADTPPAARRFFLANGAFVAIAPNPPLSSANTFTKTTVPAGAAVLQSTTPVATDMPSPDGAEPAVAASVRALESSSANVCQRGCGSVPPRSDTPMSYEVTVPAGGPRTADARVRITLDTSASDRVSLRAAGTSVALSLRFELSARLLRAAWVSPKRDAMVLELEDPGNCCPESAKVSWVGLDLQRLLGAGVTDAAAPEASAGSAAARVQAWRSGLPAGWSVTVRQLDAFVIAEARAPSAPMESDAPSCDDTDGSWTKTHRTLVATSAGQAEVTGVVLGSPVDLDKDGRQDLLVAYEHVCKAAENAASPAGANPSRPGRVLVPSGDFQVVFDRAGGPLAVGHATIGGNAPAALWNVSVQKQGRTSVIRAAGMGPGSSASPTGEMYDFKWQAGTLALARRFPGSG